MSIRRRSMTPPPASRAPPLRGIREGGANADVRSHKEAATRAMTGPRRDPMP